MRNGLLILTNDDQMLIFCLIISYHYCRKGEKWNEAKVHLRSRLVEVPEKRQAKEYFLKRPQN